MNLELREGRGVKSNIARALIVDDDVDTRSALRTSLEERGFRCDVVADGNTALRRIAHQTYDVIVIELLLPLTDGGELVISICSLEHSPVIAVHTRVFEREVYLGLRNEGVDAIFFKPHDCTMMADTLVGLFERRSSAQAGVGRSLAITKLRKGDAWIQRSQIRVEVFRFSIMILATVLLSLGWGSSIDSSTAAVCRLFGLCGLAFYFCLEFVAYSRDLQRSSLIRWAAERRLAEHVALSKQGI